MAEQTNQVACLRIPKDPNNLLLPNVSVAEVIPYKAPLKDSGPEWFKGFFTWRNTKVPVVSMELVNGEAELDVNERTRLAVINRLSDSAKFEFFAVLIKDLPTLVRVHEEDLKPEDGTTQASELSLAQLEQQVVVIPDLEKLEIMVNELA
ncbi:chemotaxis protein CheW [Litoribrevibacter albus]|uniref:Chemotaxis protein n=1 Tax=Litoribrevibacter albus TaxID=1473156 RepID=A0AA37S8D5_9GAMM|nr:chemotaxis protein CheW [Litoribrevibacter albus]GLQ30576.1 chemotaxis protein [Litoribrevibacter albus]